MYKWLFDVYRPTPVGETRMSSKCIVVINSPLIEDAVCVAKKIIQRESAYTNQRLKFINVKKMC